MPYKLSEADSNSAYLHLSSTCYQLWNVENGATVPKSSSFDWKVGATVFLPRKKKQNTACKSFQMMLLPSYLIKC